MLQALPPHPPISASCQWCSFCPASLLQSPLLRLCACVALKVLQVLVGLGRADVALELHRAQQAGGGFGAGGSLEHAQTLIDLRLRCVCLHGGVWSAWSGDNAHTAAAAARINHPWPFTLMHPHLFPHSLSLLSSQLPSLFPPFPPHPPFLGTFHPPHHPSSPCLSPCLSPCHVLTPAAHVLHHAQARCPRRS